MLELLLLSALLFEQAQNAAQVFFARDHRRQNDRLFHLLDIGRIGELSRVIDFDQLARRSRHPIPHAGAVVIRSILNSRSSRSCTISRCSSPRKPQRKPKPSATEFSGSKLKEPSFSPSFR